MWLRLFPAPSHHPRPIRVGELVLRLPEAGDYSAWLRLREESADFLRPWEPRWPTDDLSRTGFRRRLTRYQRDAAERSGYTYFLFGNHGAELLGGLSLSNIRMGASCSCSLGYWMGERHAGQGLMRRAVAMILPEAFSAMGMERIEAGCIPTNTRSIRLLEAVGFKQEGVMRDYLEIDGRRQDHVLFSMLRRDFKQMSLSRPRSASNGIGAGIGA